MNIEQLKKDLEQYFEYIKVVYQNQFGKYLKDDTKSRIQSSHDVFEIDCDKKFKYYCDKKIIFCLDVDSFIKENGLEESPDMNDISEQGKAYVHHLIENKNNLYNLIKDVLLKQIITYFVGGEKGAVEEGTIMWVSKYLSEIYHLPNNEFLESKEIDIFYKLESIVGRETILTAILNQEKNLLIKYYNLYSQKEFLEDFNELEDKLNIIYFNYQKNKNKLFFIDSIYHYENLDYDSALNEIKGVIEEKNMLEEIHKKRIVSIRDSLKSMLEYQLPFTVQERQRIVNVCIETQKIIDKFGEENYHLNELKYYKKMIELEDIMLPFAEKMWQQYLIYPTSYSTGNEFGFLVSKENNDGNEIVETTLLTDEHIRNIESNSKYNYGFIYYFRSNSLLYATTEDVLLKKMEDNHEGLETIYVDGSSYELDNQSISKLVTPKMIVSKDLENKMIKNKVFLKRKNVYPVAVFAFISGDKENSSNYNKALELSENYELPIIEIEKDFYFSIKEEPITIEEVPTYTKIEEKKISLKERMKEVTHKWLYEEGSISEKKTL